MFKISCILHTYGKRRRRREECGLYTTKNLQLNANSYAYNLTFNNNCINYVKLYGYKKIKISLQVYTRSDRKVLGLFEVRPNDSLQGHAVGCTVLNITLLITNYLKFQT